ncbi:MAG: flagellar protein FlgN [Sideroxydans sp.]|nr:flagellar protein FlgN [Sideroxydans sp.]
MADVPVAATLAEFLSNLHTERDAMRSFVSLLETEQHTLLAGETEQLLTLAETKTRTVAQLTGLGNARKQFQATLSPSDNMENWLQSHAAQELPVWREIRKLAARAQQLNHTNGEMIRVKLGHNQQALNVLHNAAQSATGLYGRDGQPNLSGMGRKLGSV